MTKKNKKILYKNSMEFKVGDIKNLEEEQELEI